jgi:sugar/nucleoside kinase (ribokinase family)
MGNWQVKKYSVYGLGNALVDTEIQVQDDELQQLGVDKGVMTLVDEPRQEELVSQLEGHLVAAKKASGGSAANSIIATTRFGKPGFYSCRVADDDNGDFYLQDLEAAGVDHNWQHARSAGTTGRCLVLISPDAERSMLSYLGISETMNSSDLSPVAIRDSEFLYIEGYLVTSPSGRAAAIEAREIAEQAGVKTSLSFSDPGMVEFFRDGMQEILGNSPLDLLFCNEVEAKQWAGSEDMDTTVAELKKVARTFAVTLGAKGSLIFDGDQILEIPGHSVEAVDSNGAGDMYAGAFLYCLSAGHDYQRAGEFANLAAARVVSRFGPRLSASEHDVLFAEFFGSAAG